MYLHSCADIPLDSIQNIYFVQINLRWLARILSCDKTKFVDTMWPLLIWLVVMPSMCVLSSCNLVVLLQYLVSVPLRMFRVWAFMGLIGQVSCPTAVQLQLPTYILLLIPLALASTY